MAKEKMEKNPLELTEKAMALVAFLREHGDEMTAKEVAAEMGLGFRSVDGTFTALQRRDPQVGYRKEVTVQDEEGNEDTVKFLVLTDYGKTAEFFARPKGE